MLSTTDCRQRSIYGPTKRLKRGLLRTLGRWSRHNYDVEVVFENARPAYKKITFRNHGEAGRVSRNLASYGPTRHLPTWRACDDKSVWVDFIDGRPCDRIYDSLLPPIADCLGQFALRRSYLHHVAPYWRRHLADLDYLQQQDVIDKHLHNELRQRARAVRPLTLRTGFDYGDPIGPNLLRRDGCGSICAIDVKNMHQNTLVGEGLAKVCDRWLCRERRAFVFAHLSRLGLADIQSAFGFIQFYERAARVRRKVERDLSVHRRVRKQAAKRGRLTALLD